MRYILILGLGIFSLYGCRSSSEVKFKQPQPESERALSNFNKSICGIYVNTYDSLYEMTIENSLIRTRKQLDGAFNRHDMDSNTIAYVTSLAGPPRIEADSLFFRQIIEDTIFMISKDQILKRLHHQYFLNTKRPDNYWRVEMMYLDRDTLMIGEINPGDSLMNFDGVIREDSATVKNKHVSQNGEVNRGSSVIYNYILDPDHRELKKMIRAGLFECTDKFVKKKGF